MRSVSSTPMYSPLRKAIVVDADQGTAFRRFTAEISSWWPFRSHSVGQAETERVVFEGRVGGRIYEVIRGGRESVWGTVTAWEPPTRTVFTWHPGQHPDTAQQIELRFVPVGQRTRLELTHTGWERLGAQARTARRGYPIGWAYVLRIYAGRRWSPVVLLLGGLTWVAMLVSWLKRTRERSVPAAG